MTQQLGNPAPIPGSPGDPVRPSERDNDVVKPRPYVLPLTVLAIGSLAFIAYALPPYLTFDPANARIPPQHPLHYTFLAGHVISGSVAIITTILQLWPWLRRNHPRAHRYSGRVYVIAGAIPSALFALAMYPVAFAPGSVAVLISAPLWMIAAVVGWIRARQRRYAEHRRWMVYSFAIMWGFGVWGFVIGNVGMHWLGINPFTAVEAARWVGWVGTLLIAHWWLERTAGRTIGGVPIRRGKSRR